MLVVPLEGFASWAHYNKDAKWGVSTVLCRGYMIQLLGEKLSSNKPHHDNEVRLIQHTNIHLKQKLGNFAINPYNSWCW